MKDLKELSIRLRKRGIIPTLPRLAVASVILESRDHLSAEKTWEIVKKDYPSVSRASVYNVLEFFVQKGLLHKLFVREGSVAYDPILTPHHHLLDVDSGIVYDIPAEEIHIPKSIKIPGFEVEDFYLVIRARKNRDLAA